MKFMRQPLRYKTAKLPHKLPPEVGLNEAIRSVLFVGLQRGKGRISSPPLPCAGQGHGSRCVLSRAFFCSHWLQHVDTVREGKLRVIVMGVASSQLQCCPVAALMR